MPLSPSDQALVNRAIEITKSADIYNTLVSDARKSHKEAQRLLEDVREQRAQIDLILAEKTTCFPWLSDALARYREYADLKVADFLESKLRPAPSAAEAVRRLSREKREALKQFYLARFRVRYYESLFPWLTEYVDTDLDELVRQDLNTAASSDDTDDPAIQILQRIPSAEYSRLSPSEKNQRALDIWKRTGAQSKWQVGLAYEGFVGFILENKQYSVRYNGALEQLEDMGRDLIAESESESLVVQCKHWSKDKTIHEKHVFQLFGSLTHFRLALDRGESPTPTKTARGLFVTTTSLSEKARDIAQHLGIDVWERFHIHEYPLIKCNISGGTGEKIYHLPFDQQYDRIKIDPSRGECYVDTVAEAESRGFRRAFKYRPPSNPV